LTKSWPNTTPAATTPTRSQAPAQAAEGNATVSTNRAPKAVQFVYHDGGRAAAGFKGETRDCVTRAITIVCDEDYRVIYHDLTWVAQEMAAKARGGRKAALAKSTSRTGHDTDVIRHYLAERGWQWTPTMRIGSGCQVHLRAEELPPGRLIVSLSRHITAVIDGVIYDTHDPSRNGSRCVYGYWSQL
jgi:hypothetical protein